MLQELPFELLSEIVSYLPSAQSLHHLSLCNRNLHKFVRDEGWKIFVQTRFPSMPARNNWRDAAHSLCTTSRSWDRRAFVARYLYPSNFIVKLPHRELETQWRTPRGQTMGYQPVIESFEESTGTAWDARRQVLAWSAGSELVLRVKEMGGKSLAPERRGTYSYLDHHGHRTRWFTYKPPKAVEGRDDITCVKFLTGNYREENPSNSATEHVILGTASGRLFLSHLELDRSSNNTLGSVFETDKRSVRSADLSPSTQGVLAVCLADTGVAVYKTPQYLYSAPERHDSVSPFCERSVLLDGEKGYRIWSTCFLSDGLLALGLGPSSKPIHVYQVTADGLSKDPIRKLGIDGTAWGCDDRVETAVPKTKEKSSAVYPITPLPWSASAGHAPGEVFLSGCYDGIIRLHDMRCPSSYESSYFDPTDDGAIYSLQTLGRERLAAGSSRHSIIKFFDLRVSGGRAYHYTDVGSSLNSSQTKDTSKKSGWNLFLNPRNNTHPTGSRWQRSRATESPVYSLSSPSPTSPTLFAGVENSVVELDFVSMLDKHPDPIFAHGLIKDQRGGINIAKSWNPKGDVLNFAMYDHSKTGYARLRTQAGVGKYTGVIDGLDERWRESS